MHAPKWVLKALMSRTINLFHENLHFPEFLTIF